MLPARRDSPCFRSDTDVRSWSPPRVRAAAARVGNFSALLPFHRCNGALGLRSVIARTKPVAAYGLCYSQRMTSKSKAGGRRDNHAPSPDVAAKKAKKAERLAKGKYQTKLQGAHR